ncbi:MAG: anaerobic ribonucleoside-triphosphate reductase activating protein [Deltaproteobacteria bacterium]|jgi:pyruvate formate lyase activating enzyme|nr:anaerobic ribonucleoside-triphosphate reductase activating protein [Deltaproteobacteria bacterium]
MLKTSTLDFPSRLSSVVFTQGCDFHCPYCHNPGLAPPGDGTVPVASVLSFLERRKGILDAVVLSGGEPTLQDGLEGFLAEAKGLGYLVKLDTNGSRPAVVERLARAGLLDYVALDLKAAPDDYPRELAPAWLSAGVRKTMAFLRDGDVPAEFRTTCVHPFIDQDSILALARAASGRVPLYLQRFRPEAVLNPAFMALHPRQPGEAEIAGFQKIAQDFLPCHVR